LRGDSLATDATGTLGVSFGAYRIKGADASTWLPTLATIAAKELTGTTVSQISAGGRTVTRIISPKNSQATYVWPQGDVLFIVITAEPTLLDDAVPAMP
jgi:hypothetical protein